MTVTSYNARYIHQYVHLFTTQSRSHPLALDYPHSQRTLRTSVRKLHTLMRKCLLPQHPHTSPLRPASPRSQRRAILRQSLACPGDATSSPSPWLQLGRKPYSFTHSLTLWVATLIKALKLNINRRSVGARGSISLRQIASAVRLYPSVRRRFI